MISTAKVMPYGDWKLQFVKLWLKKQIQAWVHHIQLDYINRGPEAQCILTPNKTHWNLKWSVFSIMV